MLRVKVELAPHGDETRAETIATLIIKNQLSKDVFNRYMYEYELNEDLMSGGTYRFKDIIYLDRIDNPMRFVYNLLKGLYE